MTESRSCPMSRLVPLGEPSAQQCVGVLVGGSLPRRARLAEERLDAERGFDVGPAGHLAALVPGEAAHELGGLAAQRRGDRGGDLGRAVAVGQRCGDRVAAGALGEGDRGGEVRFADDEVAVPVAGFCTVLDVVGPVGYRPVFPQRAGLLGLRDAARPTAPAAPRQLRPGARRQAAARVVRVARPAAAAGQLAMHRGPITAQAAALRPRRCGPAPSDDSMNTRSSKLSLAAILDTSIGRLHVLATVIMTIHLQPPMEFATGWLAPRERLADRLARPSLSIGELRAASCSWTLLEAGDPSWVENRRDDGLASVASYGPTATLSPVRFASLTQPKTDGPGSALERETVPGRCCFLSAGRALIRPRRRLQPRPCLIRAVQEASACATALTMRSATSAAART